MEEQTHIMGGKIKELAGKILSDPNFKYLFDEATQNTLQLYINNSSVEKVPLTSEDYYSLYSKWNEEIDNPTQMSKDLTKNEIEGKANEYHKKYLDTLKQEKQFIKELANKVSTDYDFIYTLDEQIGYKIVKLINDDINSLHKTLIPQPLSSKDYLAISNRWSEEFNNPTELSSRMTNEQISEKVNEYYQKFQNALRNEQELKSKNMENTPAQKIFNEIQENFNPKEKAYLKNLLLYELNQNIYSPLQFEKHSGISPESVEKVKNYYDNFKKENYTPVSEKDLEEFGENYANIYVDEQFESMVDKILVQMAKDDDFNKEINPIFREVDENFSQEKDAEKSYEKEMMNKEFENNENQMTKSEAIQDYFENYIIDSQKSFSHKDVYAFLTQAGKNELKDFLSKNLPELTMPNDLKKNSVIESIVNPIRKMDVSKIAEIKEAMNQHCKTNIKEKQYQEVVNKVDNWDEYYFNLRNNINIDMPLSHQDVYAFLNTPNFNQENKIKAINNYLPDEKKINVEITPENLYNKSYIISSIVYPINDTGKTKEFKTFLSELYKNEQKTENVQSKNCQETKSKYTAQEFDEFYSNYALNYNINKALSHTLVYSYINNPNISSEEKMDYLNDLYKKLNESKELDIEKPFINDIKELTSLSKNKILSELVYPLKENTGNLEEEFKYDIARSFINSREQTANYSENLKNEPLDLSNTNNFNIDHLNKMVLNESLPVLSKYGIEIKENLTIDDKLLIIQKVNSTPELISKINADLNFNEKQTNQIKR